MGAPSTWTRLRGHVRGELRGRTGKNVIEDYSAPAGTTFANIEAAFPRWLPYPGETGFFRPLLEDYTIEAERAPDGLDLVRLYFLAPTWRGVLERNPDKARLLAMINEVAVRPKKDLYGDPVWDERVVKGVLTRWQPISGSGLQHHARTMLRLQVVATQGILGTILNLHDTINAGATSFGAGKGTLRMAGAHTETVMAEAALTRLDIVMEYNKAGWNKDTKVQKYEWRVNKIQVRDENDAPIAKEYRDVGDWYAIEGDTVTASLYYESSWAALDRQIVWT